MDWILFLKSMMEDLARGREVYVFDLPGVGNSRATGIDREGWKEIRSEKDPRLRYDKVWGNSILQFAPTLGRPQARPTSGPSNASGPDLAKPPYLKQVLQFYTDAIEAWRDSLDLTTMVLIGHSFGVCVRACSQWLFMNTHRVGLRQLQLLTDSRQAPCSA